MSTVSSQPTRALAPLIGAVAGSLDRLGDLTQFSGRAVAWTVRRWPSPGTLLPIFFNIGVRSISVVAITGLFIGMVLAVQSYVQFHEVGLATRLGVIVNTSVVRELGPVLAATMLAGRIGSAMAAQLGTMRVTEQIDALECLGVNPVHYLVVPRLMACVLLIPLLTILANFMGVLGGALICVEVYHVEGYHYWHNAQGFITMWDLGTGLLKPMFFGAAIALISCHRGFNAQSGAEGVGRAATESFVYSFIAILALDFFLALFFNNLYDVIWHAAGPRLLS
jgi:phospholipid/cholesterol/gamma-HCH transport system permease protein